MTMETFTRDTRSTEQYHLARDAASRAAAKLAAKWGCEAVGREYPTQVRRANCYSFARAGKWYVVRDGERHTATAAQARALNNIADLASGVGCIHPIAAVRTARGADA